MHDTYGFYGRLTKSYPSQIVVDVTQVCNLACIHCPHGEYVKSSDYRGEHLTERLHNKLIDDVSQNSNGNCQYLRYTAAGEPLCHPHIFELLAHAKKHSGTTISLTTNGTMLDSHARKQLFETNVDIIDISIDAYTAETYSKIRRGGNRDRVYDNVLNLIKEKCIINAPLRIVTTFIEQDGNRHEKDVFKSFWENAGADYVIIRRLHSNAGANTDMANSMRKNIQAAPRTPCLYPWERLVITPHGRLSFCPADWTHKAGFVDFKDVSVADAWQSAFMKSLREAHMQNQFSNFSLCAQCPDWSCTRWPVEGRSFADMVIELRDKK